MSYNIKNMEEQTNKEKIILVLRESLKFGRETNFTYNDMFAKHREIQFISNISKVVKEKIELFNNMDESSHLFISIYDCAKLALSNMLEKKRYNYYSAELIMKISSLEEIFRKKLKPIGIHINEDIKPIEKNTSTTLSNQIEEEIIDLETGLDEDMIFEPLTKKAKFIGQGVSGKELVEEKQKRNELISAIKTTSFD